ncbi:Membrane lipoprotein TmpC [Paenibacillus sp. CECT 9249]|uniref:BMP family lipoprotein n=1 Tax=Paenibacillus sp. CECT 9249 TaxID=2845385 RepID=UPI001E319112|nr:BMP family ABC transporter substrate-binding protein [Paenibacillus sp. CECT 9249]CAH0120385.1 Membrane lipoprotein TmpC [Paenibacillus sp. CECT 9249]
MKRLSWLSVVFMLFVSMIVSACNSGKSAGGTEQNEGNAGQQSVRIGLVTDIGGVNDKAFSQTAWEALEQIKKDKGADIKYLQSKTDADFVPNLSQFVKNGYDLTWGTGFVMVEAVQKVARDNPNAKLAIVDNEVDEPNVKSVLFKEHEGSFLVGVIAGLMTESDKVGFVGGMKIPVIAKFEAGFKAGVKAVNPDAEIIVNYTGAFDKPDLGKAAAATIYNAGADIIFHASSGTGAGVFNEASDRLKQGKRVWVIGVDRDQSLEYGDDVTLTSMMKRVDEAVYRVSEELIDGTFEGGTTLELGLKENGVGIADTSSKNVPEDVLKQVEEYKEKIVNGEIEVPME